jgi:hypothetical protein
LRKKEVFRVKEEEKEKVALLFIILFKSKIELHWVLLTFSIKQDVILCSAGTARHLLTNIYEVYEFNFTRTERFEWKKKTKRKRLCGCLYIERHGWKSLSSSLIVLVLNSSVMLFYMYPACLVVVVASILI